MDLNVQDWKEFKLSDIFEMQNGYFNNKPETIDSLPSDNPIKFLGATAENNGITDYCGIEAIRYSSKTGDSDNSLDNKIYEGNCITITNDGSVCHAYYQDTPFTSSHSQTICIPKFELNPILALFICTIIDGEQFKWSYGRKLHDLNKSKAIIIKLPIKHNPDGTPVIDTDKTYSDEGYVPDWQFMEDYIKSLHSEPITTTRGAAESLSLGVEKWEEFTVNELFDLVPTKGKDSTELAEGTDIPYIAAKHDENGLMMLCQKQGYEDWISQGNCIVFVNLGAGSAGYTNYMQEDFIGMSGKTTCGYIKDVMTPNIGIFLSTVLSAERPKYSFGRSWTGDRLTSTTIKLPIQRDASGNPVIDHDKKYSDKGYIPDWDFMERYIDSLPYSDRVA